MSGGVGGKGVCLYMVLLSITFLSMRKTKGSEFENLEAHEAICYGQNSG
jgi:hypothetical protein